MLGLRGCPPKLTDWCKGPKMTLKQLGSFIAGIRVSVHRNTLSCTLHRAGLYGRMSRKKAIAMKK